MVDFSMDFEVAKEILGKADIGLWAIEIDDNALPRLFADDTMLRLLGVEDNLSPEDVYNAWYSRIHPEHYVAVSAAVNKMTSGSHAEVLYPWNHPSLGERYVRCGGVRDKTYTQGVRLEGCHQDVTTLIQIQKKAELMEKQLKAAEKESQKAMNLATMDAMTRCYNRLGFNENAVEIIADNKKNNIYTYLMYIDMDNLKKINDTYGHEEGDFSIKVIADILNTIARGRGIVGRMGGDEFCCVVSYRESDDQGKFFDRQIEKDFDDFNFSSDKPYKVTVSVGGVSIAPSSDLSFEEALSIADERLYEVKRAKKTIRQ